MNRTLERFAEAFSWMSGIVLLASIPSIVIGLSGFALAIFLHRHYSERIYPSLLNLDQVKRIADTVVALPHGNAR